ncbi:hypothetical protein PIB30_064909 [Stylosanthes scabra]|uniref:Uncharacterized protein n=1 Tax=Stylosanthes scabra TaxID=79078 RepID=A0ABU6SLY9_9FABA|nr:hypothetical protein [Stylosanthes scabra]
MYLHLILSSFEVRLIKPDWKPKTVVSDFWLHIIEKQRHLEKVRVALIIDKLLLLQTAIHRRPWLLPVLVRGSVLLCHCLFGGFVSLLILAPRAKLPFALAKVTDFVFASHGALQR